MQYKANIQIDVPGWEEIAEFILELDADFDNDMSETFVSEWSIVSINDVDAETIPEVVAAVKAQLDDFTVETALLEDYLA